jgi:hypothetical protein
MPFHCTTQTWKKVSQHTHVKWGQDLLFVYVIAALVKRAKCSLLTFQ